MRSLHTSCCLAFLTTLAMPACRESAAPAGLACTENFAIQTVAVRDGAGALVTDATVLTTLVRTGARITPQTLALMSPGNYVILDDGATAVLRRAGDQARVTGTSARGAFSANYEFDVPGGCHIRKLSGPDTVVVR